MDTPVDQPSASNSRSPRRILLRVLSVVAGVVACVWLADFLIIGTPLAARFGLALGLTLTPPGWKVLTGVMLALLVGAAVLTARGADRGAAPLALVLVALALPAFLGKPAQAGLVALGCLTLLTAYVVTRTRGDRVPGRRFGRLLSFAVAVAAMLLMVGAVVMFFAACDALLGDVGTTTEFARETSPDGSWLAVGIYNDGGATGGDAHVDVQRDVGVVRFWRNVWEGEGPEPVVRWLDSRTLSVGGHEVDVFRDPPVDE